MVNERRVSNDLPELAPRYYRLPYGKADCVAVPMHRQELDAVQEFAENTASENVGNGVRIGTGDDDRWDEEIVVDWNRGVLLPQFSGLVIRFSYDREEGTFVQGVWGLLAVRK